MAEINPCHKCGGTQIQTVYIAPFYNDWYGIQCLCCEHTVVESTKEKAIEEWNGGTEDG